MNIMLTRLEQDTLLTYACVAIVVLVAVLVYFGVLAYRATRPTTPVERGLSLLAAYQGGLPRRARECCWENCVPSSPEPACLLHGRKLRVGPNPFTRVES